MNATPLEEHLRLQAERSQGFFWNRIRWKLVFDFLPAEEKTALVDVGAGPGFLGDVLRKERPNIEYRFVEPLASLEELNEQRFGVESNFKDRDHFGDSKYVTLLDVLEHQEDDRAFAKELAEKMEPGSLLLLTVPALPALWSEWDVALGHFRRYKKDTLVSAFDGLPFEVEEVSYLFPELLPLGLLRRLKDRVRPSQNPDGEASFPDLPHVLNEGLYRLGHLTMRSRSVWPVGTSVFSAIRRTS